MIHTFNRLVHTERRTEKVEARVHQSIAIYELDPRVCLKVRKIIEDHLSQTIKISTNYIFVSNPRIVRFRCIFDR